MDKSKVTELSTLREIANGDEKIIRELIRVFVREMSQNLEQFRQYYEKKEWQEIAKLAHKIKPNMSYLGMTEGRELIIKIEAAAQSGNIPENMGDLITELIPICNQSVKELRIFLGQLKSNRDS